MPSREENSQIGGTGQLSENRGGLKSFSDPSDIAKGGGSKLDDPDFRTAEGFRKRERNRTEINRQMHFNRKKERAVRVGYRAAVRRGDGRGALKLLDDAEAGGVNPFGIRQSGDNARQADAQIQGKRKAEVRGGQRELDPQGDFFQRNLKGAGDAGNGEDGKDDKKFRDDLANFVMSEEFTQPDELSKFITPTEHIPFKDRIGQTLEKLRESVGGLFDGLGGNSQPAAQPAAQTGPSGGVPLGSPVVEKGSQVGPAIIEHGVSIASPVTAFEANTADPPSPMIGSDIGDPPAPPAPTAIQNLRDRGVSEGNLQMLREGEEREAEMRRSLASLMKSREAAGHMPVDPEASKTLGRDIATEGGRAARKGLERIALTQQKARTAVAKKIIQAEPVLKRNLGEGADALKIGVKGGVRNLGKGVEKGAIAVGKLKHSVTKGPRGILERFTKGFIE